MPNRFFGQAGPENKIRAILPCKDIPTIDAFNVVVLDLGERLAAFCRD